MKSLRCLSLGAARIASCFALALLIACSVSVDSEGETQSRALIDRLPAGAVAIAWIDFEALAAAIPPEDWTEYEQMLQDDEDLRRIEDITGINMREDLRQVGVAVMPGTDGADDPVALVSVDYDRGRLDSLLADVETITYQGATMYRVNDVARNLEAALGEQGSGDAPTGEPAAGDTGPDAYMVLLDPETLAIGTEPSLRVVVDVDAGRHEALKADAAMNALISDVAGRGQIWLVATKASWDDQVAGLGPAAGGMVPTTSIESIETMTLSMRFGDEMVTRLTGIAGTPKDAALLADTISGGISMGKMMLQGSQPELFDILDRGVSSGVDDRTFHIEATLTRADVEVLQRLADQQGGSGDIGAGR